MRVGVVGAGLAGLSAACELADRGHAVKVLERRPFAGGKTYSFTDREIGETVDNGQHVFMACTTEYIAFLRRLGTIHLTRRQKRLAVPVLDAHGRRSDLRAAALPAPFHLAPSFVGYRHLSMRDKLAIGRLIASLSRGPSNAAAALTAVTFADWLQAHGQSASAIRDFWDFLVLPTLNCTAEESDAASALFVLREGFLSSSGSAAIGVAKVGLSDLHVDPALKYLEARGGEMLTGTRVDRLVLEEGRVRGVSTGDGIAEFDAVVLAVPHRQAAALLGGVASPALVQQLNAIPVNPIVNAHLWFDRAVLDLPFAAVVGCELQWLFNASYGASGATPHLVVSLSAAHEFVELTKAEIVERVIRQLRFALPAVRAARLRHSVVIKEPEATFVPAPGVHRPPADIGLPNLFLAGAYTATGWPATMESAVRSGLAASRLVHVRCQR